MLFSTLPPGLSQVAIAYLMQKVPYCFPIIGGCKVEHLLSNIEALDISLSPEEIAFLESVIPFDLGFPSTMIMCFNFHHITVFLAAQGFLAAGTSILTALEAEFPNCLGNKNAGVRWGFEFLWEAAGERPETMPWEAPSKETLEEMDVLHGELYPRELEEQMCALEVIDTQIGLGDVVQWPYSLRAAAMISAELGDKERVLKYLDLQCQLIIARTDLCSWWEITRCRILAPIIVEGSLGKSMGQTAEGAQKDAEAIIAAFKSWATTREPCRLAHEAEARKFVALNTQSLLEILEPRKADNDESLQRPPAAAADIANAEAHLGLSLPDYRDFLLVSNGMNFMLSLELPELRAVGELAWEKASDLGLDELEVTLGLKVDKRETELLPKMGRLLMISSADDEEQVWLLEPSQVENTLQILKAERQLTHFSQPVGWRIVLWRHWCPEPIWYRSFRGYLEAAARKA
ncbi:hypothetical protein C8R44DRAFT_875541 [Mycena epipterygia]|nr:hypothetical protein C8R44DRAFT_875541 [Mycena epipterygia]